jgi:hypothetical protein
MSYLRRDSICEDMEMVLETGRIDTVLPADLNRNREVDGQ